ncbi:MAG: FAD-dependent oxidoreductase [Deltaproteobacteria bacterium]|nr:FAD-dependent oxidoreductase [Deltaproteobacteria bacterium]MCB9788737.1 FAD-dependent oxidoreductase [Deltaproteobacteria bacterium]
MEDGVDLAVVGGGVVGCAIAAEASARGLSVALLEREPGLGRGGTARNSGVLHSGLYYRPGSVAATACVRGQALCYELAAALGVPHRRTGKLVVAHDDAELEALDALLANAAASGARDVERVTGGRAAQLEPAMRQPLGALWCPHTGIIDAPALASALAARAARGGALVAVGAAVLGAAPSAGGTRLDTGRGPILAAQVVNSAGLGAPAIAALLGDEAPTLWPCRGDWYALRAQRPPARLVYPVRAAGQTGLGVHVCLDLGGGVRLGPDARFTADADLGTPPPSTLLDAFRAAGERLLGPLPPGALRWDGAGVRPRLRGPDDPGPVEFRIERGRSGALHLFGVESPGLTAAPALAELVLQRIVA